MDESATVPVDIIVPLYRNLDVCRCCVESVLAHTDPGRARLVLVDDASPEPALSAWAASLAADGRAILLRHETNLGFVAAVNAGMAQDTERDVVLLNSDTEVPAGWLERLQRAALSAADIATVTPFSNNGSICSYPHFCTSSPLPEGLDLATLDGLFARANAGRVVDLPTAVGFCMYIRRSALQRFGAFDAERYGRGYGEENDFSRRVAAGGLRNVLCGDLFVFHEGAASFGEERHALMASAEQRLLERYPDYGRLVSEFISADPLQVLRDAVDELRLELPAQEAVLLREWRLARTAWRRSEQEAERLLQDYNQRHEHCLQLLEQERHDFRALEAEYQALLEQARRDFAATDKALAETRTALAETRQTLIHEQQARETLELQNEALRARAENTERQLAHLNSLLVIRFRRWLKETFSRT